MAHSKPKLTQHWNEQKPF